MDELQSDDLLQQEGDGALMASYYFCCCRTWRGYRYHLDAGKNNIGSRFFNNCYLHNTNLLNFYGFISNKYDESSNGNGATSRI